jgi:ubiquinone/menaquinone biosynthesis C-methylase UbiE
MTSVTADIAFGFERKNLGSVADFEAVCAIIDVAGLNLVDVGCGPAIASRELVARGATVLGVEPDPIQAAKHRAGDSVPGLTLVEARAEHLPIDSASVDGVLFFRSLHHVPVEAMDTALAEAARVLKPDGFLCVVEPGMQGSHFAVMRPFHDETMVRTEAQASLARTARKLFQQASAFHFDQSPRYTSFDAMVTRVTGLTYNSTTRDQVETEEVRALFEDGRTPQGDYVFEQPMLLDLYRKPV